MQLGSIRNSSWCGDFAISSKRTVFWRSSQLWRQRPTLRRCMRKPWLSRTASSTSTVAIQGLNSSLQLSPSTAFKNSFLLNLGSKSFLCDRIEGHKIIAATRHLELRLRSRPCQKRTTPQPQKWVRFRGPKTGPQTQPAE